MFERDEAAFLAEGALLPDDDGSTCLVEDAKDGRGLAAVVFYRPEEAADRGAVPTFTGTRDPKARGCLFRHTRRPPAPRSTTGAPQFAFGRAVLDSLRL